MRLEARPAWAPGRSCPKGRPVASTRHDRRPPVVAGGRRPRGGAAQGAPRRRAGQVVGPRPRARRALRLAAVAGAVRRQAPAPGLLPLGLRRRRRRPGRPAGRRRRRGLRAAARLRPLPRRRDGRLRHPAGHPHDPPRPSPTATSRAAGAARPAASARAWPSWSATSPSSTPTSSCAAPRRRPRRMWNELRIELNIGQYLDIARDGRGPAQPGGGAADRPLQVRASTPSSGRCTSVPPWPRPSGPTSCCPRCRPTGCRWATPSSSATTCSAPSATTRAPASPSATTCGRASRRRCWPSPRPGHARPSAEVLAAWSVAPTCPTTTSQAIQDVLVDTGALAELESEIDRLTAEALDAVDVAPHHRRRPQGARRAGPLRGLAGALSGR